MFFWLKSFCGRKILSEGVELMAQLMPLVSIALIFYAIALRNIVEIWLCLTYALINLAANLFLLIGCRKGRSLHFLPWLSWVMLCITLSSTFAPVMIYAGFHIEFVDKNFKSQKPIESKKFIAYGSLLIFKTLIFAYFWSGVFALFKDVRKNELNSSENPIRENLLHSRMDESRPIIGEVHAELFDEPPPYVMALQETKYSFQYDSPPSYSQAILFSENDLCSS